MTDVSVMMKKYNYHIHVSRTLFLIKCIFM